MQSKKSAKPVCAVIPGFGEKTGDDAYVQVRRELTRLGWRVLPVDIVWKRTTMTGWLRQAEDVISANGGADAIFGFSFGAMLAILLAAKGQFSAIVAASPSPYFKESLPTLPPIAEKVLGRRRMRDFRKYSMTEASKMKVRTARVLVGGDDFPRFFPRRKNCVVSFPGCPRLTVIPGAQHDLSDPRYMKAVKKILAGLRREKRRSS